MSAGVEDGGGGIGDVDGVVAVAADGNGGCVAAAYGDGAVAGGGVDVDARDIRVLDGRAIDRHEVRGDGDGFGLASAQDQNLTLIGGRDSVIVEASSGEHVAVAEVQCEEVDVGLSVGNDPDLGEGGELQGVAGFFADVHLEQRRIIDMAHETDVVGRGVDGVDGEVCARGCKQRVACEVGDVGRVLLQA